MFQLLDREFPVADASRRLQTLATRRHAWHGTESDSAQIIRRGLAGSSICNNVKRDLLSLVEGMHTGAFDGADVHEDILAAVVRLDKAEAFLAIEPLHGSLRHKFFSQLSV